MELGEVFDSRFFEDAQARVVEDSLLRRIHHHVPEPLPPRVEQSLTDEQGRQPVAKARLDGAVRGFLLDDLSESLAALRIHAHRAHVEALARAAHGDAAVVEALENCAGLDPHEGSPHFDYSCVGYNYFVLISRIWRYLTAM
jgi:hypothetical protein